MVNAYVRGDSLSEFYAFVFYPLILWSILRLRRAPTAGHTVLLAASFGSLLITHTSRPSSSRPWPCSRSWQL